MTTKELKLAANMLCDYSSELGNHGCNDWEWPKDWTQEEKIQFIKEYHSWNGDPQEFNINHLYLPDYAVAHFLSSKLYCEA